MTITGKYNKDQNFTTVFVETEKRIYTIARSTGDWGSIGVGERTATGYILTQELFDEWMNECTQEGTFDLKL